MKYTFVQDNVIAFVACLMTTVFMMADVRAEISQPPECNNSVISVTVDDDSSLSSGAIIQLDGVSMSGTHNLSNDNKTISVTHTATCDNIDFSALTIIDGSTTHQ